MHHARPHATDLPPAKLTIVAFYEDCEGIRAVANQSAFIITFDEINITYDRGINPDGTSIPIEGVDPTRKRMHVRSKVPVRNGDRIIVQVSTTYEPILTLLPIDPMEVVSASARSFLISIPIVGNALPTGFAAETSTPSPAPTVITATHRPPSHRPPLPPSSRPQQYSLTSRRQPHNRRPQRLHQPTQRSQPTRQASLPPQLVAQGLTGISHGPLIIEKNVMQMSINNQTGHVLTAAQVYLEWNHDTGHIRPGPQPAPQANHVRQAGMGW